MVVGRIESGQWLGCLAIGVDQVRVVSVTSRWIINILLILLLLFLFSK